MPEPETPNTPTTPEQIPEPSQPSSIERSGIDSLTPEQVEHAERMFKPIQDPKANAALRQAAKERRSLDSNSEGPAVPLTAKEMAEAEERYDTGWVGPVVPALSPDEQTQKEREGLGNLKKAVELMDQFELAYSLQELHAITTIPVAELVNHPVRKPANIALVHIRKALDLLDSKQRIPEIDERFLSLSRAVGIYNGLTKTLDHDRG